MFFQGHVGGKEKRQSLNSYLFDTKSQAFKYYSLQIPDESETNINPAHKKLSRRIYNRIFISVLEGNKFINIKNGGYHQEQDGCVEFHRAKDFFTIKSNIRRKQQKREIYFNIILSKIHKT